MKKRILLGASYSNIEPLGLLHLAGLARDLGWDRKIHLVRDYDYELFFELVKDYRPDVIGFNVYTGNHMQTFKAFAKIKKDFPNIITVVGGPHATYFPGDSSKFADYVVMSEGFNGLRRILSGEVKPGIIPLKAIEKFPHPDRETFYNDYTDHANSKIKSVISMTGCPYSCTYCYNSSSPNDIKDNLPPEVADMIAQTKGLSNRLFPHNVRTVNDVIMECAEIAERWPINVIYFQDDVHGFDTKEWLPNMALRWKKEVKVPYHAQMRFEMTKNQERLDLLSDAGCFGLTLAIEAADYIIRDEVLDRKMKDEIIFEGMKALSDRGFKVRTEQITGLPYGATTKPTLMNLDADLQLLELNIKLREQTNLPTMAWASTLVPYARTKLGFYCHNYGHYDMTNNNGDVHDTFFERSIMNFPKEWVGSSLKDRKKDPALWLHEEELEKYRDKNAELRRLFNFFAMIPKGHSLARSYLNSAEPFSYERLGRETIKHLESMNSEGEDILSKIKLIEDAIQMHTKVPTEILYLKELVPYFAVLPKGILAMKRFIDYGRMKNGLTPTVLSTATRHHLYDEVLYNTGNDNQTLSYGRLAIEGRRLSKV